MNTRIHESVRDDKGFTLVELAIVMVIIGLLIGGILKGQEMIANAQVTSTVAQAKGVTAANSTFRDMFDSFPGDMPNATAAVRLSACVAAPCQGGGNGDGRLANVPGTALAATSGTENYAFWVQLNAADLVSGVDGSATVAWGQGLPSAPIGGGLTAGYFGGGVLGQNATAKGAPYLTIQSAVGAIAGAAGSGAMTASQAARMDRKMDDGSPTTGSVFTNDAACVDVVATNYPEAADASNCDMFVRL